MRIIIYDIDSQRIDSILECNNFFRKDGSIREPMRRMINHELFYHTVPTISHTDDHYTVRIN